MNEQYVCQIEVYLKLMSGVAARPCQFKAALRIV